MKKENLNDLERKTNSRNNPSKILAILLLFIFGMTMSAYLLGFILWAFAKLIHG
jgi:hypothetical protein